MGGEEHPPLPGWLQLDVGVWEIPTVVSPVFIQVATERRCQFLAWGSREAAAVSGSALGPSCVDLTNRELFPPQTLFLGIVSSLFLAFYTLPSGSFQMHLLSSPRSWLPAA